MNTKRFHAETERRRKKKESDSDEIRTREECCNAEKSRKDRVLCHPLGRVPRMAELQCQKQESIDHPKTVTVHPFGAYPHLILLILGYLDHV